MRLALALWTLVVIALLATIALAHMSDMDHPEVPRIARYAKAMAWTTIGLFIVAVFVQIVTEECHECFTGKQVAAPLPRRSQASACVTDWRGRPAPTRYHDLPCLSSVLSTIPRVQAHGLF